MLAVYAEPTFDAGRLAGRAGRAPRWPPRRPRHPRHGAPSGSMPSASPPRRPTLSPPLSTRRPPGADGTGALDLADVEASDRWRQPSDLVRERRDLLTIRPPGVVAGLWWLRNGPARTPPNPSSARCAPARSREGTAARTRRRRRRVDPPRLLPQRHEALHRRLASPWSSRHNTQPRARTKTEPPLQPYNTSMETRVSLTDPTHHVPSGRQAVSDPRS